MAGGGPRARYYAGANYLSIFSAQGSNPLQDCKLFGKGVTKIYDKSVKGYVYNINGGVQSKLQLPKDDSKSGLQLLHHFLVLQLFVPQGVHFSIELRVSDMNNTRRKMYFSTSFGDLKCTPLHCQIPISMVIRNKWLSLAFHVADLFNNCFRGGVNFRSIDILVLSPVCKLRKIFTMRCRMRETILKGYLEDGSEDCLPQEHIFAAGVDACVQTLDMSFVQSTVISNNDTHVDDSQVEGFDSYSRKSQSGKTESVRAVHVAFGTRMPLPLSTVQINTDLPHDKCPTYLKEKFGKVHLVGDHDTTEITQEVNLPNNMITRALRAVSEDHDPLRRKLSCGTLDCKVMNKPRIGKTSYVDQSPKEKVNIPCPMSGELEVILDQNLSSVSQDPRPDSPRMSLQNVNPISQIALEMNNTKSLGRWNPKKKDVQTSTYMKHQRKDQNSKEYKHSKYMDSPPGSPPCGWEKCIGGNQLEDITFNDNFLEGSWMNNHLNESIDAGKPCLFANSLKEKILSSMHHHPCIQLDDKEINDARDVLLSTDDYDLVGSMPLLQDEIDESIQGLKNKPTRDSGGQNIVKREFGTPHGQFCKVSDPVIYNNYCEGQCQSSRNALSNNDNFQQGFQRSFSCQVTNVVQNPGQNLGGISQSNSHLQCKLQTPLLANEFDKNNREEATLMIDIHDDCLLPNNIFEKKRDANMSLHDSLMKSVLSTEMKVDGDSRFFAPSNEACIEGEQEYPLKDTPPKLRASRDYNNNNLGLITSTLECDMSKNSWLIPEPNHYPTNVCSEYEQSLAQEDSNQGGPMKTNIRPEEDLDLLYDPTLDCYYDPKTNRYYELK